MCSRVSDRSNPTILMKSGLWCCGNLSLGSIASGIITIMLPWLSLKTSAMPSASIAERRVSGAFVRLLDSAVVAGTVVFIASSAGASSLKSCAGLFPRSDLMTGHLPPSRTAFYYFS